MPLTREELLAAVACLRRDGLVQTQIALRLDISQSAVSRALAEAEETEILKVSRSVDPSRVTPQAWLKVDQLLYGDAELVARLKQWSPHPPSLHICQDGSFHNEAAGVVVGLLKYSRVVGVMCGVTVRRLIACVQDCLPHGKAALPQSIQCVPLAGDAVHFINSTNEHLSASLLSGEMQQALTGPAESGGPSLLGVPAYLPRALVRSGRRDPLWDFIRGFPGYKAIFGSEAGGRPWVDRVDTIVTGVGIMQWIEGELGPGTGVFISERLATDGMAPAELEPLICGDMAGVLFPKEGLGAKERKEVDELNVGWTGIKQEQLLRVAEQARRSELPGNIVLAAGKAKAPVLRALVKGGYVNHLIIDLELAAGMKALETC